MQNPSELAAVVSFRDDDRKWGRIEVGWWVATWQSACVRFAFGDITFDEAAYAIDDFTKMFLFD